MATTAVSTTAVPNAVIALGTGSGIDIKALAENLVNAEKQPKAELIQKSIDKSTAQISGYSIVANAIGQIQSSLDALADNKLYSSFNTTSSLPNAVTVTASGTSVLPGSYRIAVSQLAQPQRSVSNLLQSSVSIAQADLTLSIVKPGGNPVNVLIAAGKSTPEGIREAVNKQTGVTGVTANLVNTGMGVRLVLTGALGAQNGFSLGVSAVGGSDNATAIQTALGILAPDQQAVAASLTAQDAAVNIDGLEITSSSNTLSDALPGITVNLSNVTTGDPAIASITRDTSELKSAFQQLVSNYNDVQSILDAATDPKSGVEKLGGSLAGITAIRSIRDQLRRILLPEDSAIADPSAPLTDFRQLGLMVGQDGKMNFSALGEQALKLGDTATLDNLLSNRFEDVRKLMLSEPTFIGSNPNGIPLWRDGRARAMADQLGGRGRGLDVYTRDGQPSSATPLSMLAFLQKNGQTQITKDQQRLTDLNDRMSQIMDRYIKQFAIMDSLVGQSKSVRSGIENSFKGMSNSR